MNNGASCGNQPAEADGTGEPLQSSTENTDLGSESPESSTGSNSGAGTETVELSTGEPPASILSHFKGHSMAGFGGAIKNTSIGLGSSEGKSWIHTGGTSKRALTFVMAFSLLTGLIVNFVI